MFFSLRRKSWQGLKEVYPDDTFLVSYPRSGNTWMRFLLSFLVHDRPPLNLCDLEENIPDIHTSLSNINEHLTRPRYIKSHFKIMPPKGKIIYLYRDGRDSLLSYYYYSYPKALNRPPFIDFLKARQNDYCIGKWSSHVEGALSFKEKEPNRIYLLKYENLIRETKCCLTEVSRFLRLNVSEEKLNAAIDTCAWDKLRQMEQQTRNLDPGEVPFFRKGTTEQWRDCYSEDEIQVLGNDFGKMLHRLGYSPFR